MSVLVDTNVLLRRTQSGHPDYGTAVESIARLVATGDPVCVCSQNIAEFWNVATRPAANNGLGLSVELTSGEVEDIERTLTLLPDSAATYAEWKRLVVQYRVMGTKVHDTRLVAAMNIHGIARILTFDTNDFLRYGITVLHPLSLIA
jgi:predicted nucleic acid-binding protein